MIRVVTKLSDRKALRDWMRPPPFIMNAELSKRGTEERLFASWPGAAAGSGRLSYDGETLLFKQLHFCAYRLSRLYRAAHRNPTATHKRQYGLWEQRYHQVRARLIEGNIGLVYDLIGRSRFATLDRDEMSSEGMMALLRAVDTFDPWRGFRFSTYACNAILRAFSRAAMADTKRRNVMVAAWDPEFEKSDLPEARREDAAGLYVERLSNILDSGTADLSDIEKSVLRRRFPAEGGPPRQTLEDIGRQMRVSKERVRQIQLSAMSKLRQALEADSVLS